MLSLFSPLAGAHNCLAQERCSDVSPAQSLHTEETRYLEFAPRHLSRRGPLYPLSSSAGHLPQSLAGVRWAPAKAAKPRQAGGRR